MVDAYYESELTEYSEQELQSVLQAAEPPAALLGGWAVHLQVTDRFAEEHGRQYIGSRDIDIGVHVDPDWSSSTVQDRPAGRTLARIEMDLDYERSRFGFLKQVDRETGEVLTEEQAADRAMHQLYSLYVDVIPDTTELDAFESVFGFRPPAEPLLAGAFDGRATPLRNHVSWDVPESTVLVDPELLAAMKVRSLPDRGKSHKQVKDVADLFALLWYAGSYRDMIASVEELTTPSDQSVLSEAVNESLYDQAGGLLGVQPERIEDVFISLL